MSRISRSGRASWLSSLALIADCRLAGDRDGAGSACEPAGVGADALPATGASLDRAGSADDAPRKRRDGPAVAARDRDRLAGRRRPRRSRLPLGIALAFFLFRTDLWGRGLLLAVIGLSAFVPLPLHATAWLGALGNVGSAPGFRRPAYPCRPLRGRVRARDGGVALGRLDRGGRPPCGRARAGRVGIARPWPWSRLAASHAAACSRRDCRGGPGDRRLDRRRHDSHRPLADPHLCRGGLSSIQPGTRARRSGRGRRFRHCSCSAC